MCTVTVLPARDVAIRSDGAPLVRIVCNRDEQRSRPVSGGPVRRRMGNRMAIMPIDPSSGGTWIGANDAGLIACLVNSNPPIAPGIKPKPTPRLSRGTIVPALLAAETIHDALELACALDLAQFPPFRVVVFNADSFLVASSDSASLTFSEPAPLQHPLLLTSSGLGDHLVECPRRDLFDQVFSSAPDPLAAQARFHEHRWPERPHLSVLMSRPDARTVSRCVADLFPYSIALSHTILSDRLVPVCPSAQLELSLRRAEVTA